MAKAANLSKENKYRSIKNRSSKGIRKNTRGKQRN